jgi:hypothetical protein
MSLRKGIRALRRRLRAAMRRIRNSAKKRYARVKPLIKQVIDGAIEDAVGILKRRAFALMTKLAKTDWSKARKGRSLTRFLKDTLKEEAVEAGEELKAKTKAGLEGLDGTDIDIVHKILYKAWKNSR